MNKNRNEQDNRWYEVTLKDQSSRIVKGQQSIPAIKRKYKGKIRSIRRITLQGLRNRPKEKLGEYIAFWIWNIIQEIKMHTRRKSFPSGY